jgi:hypothetical protein
MEDRAVGSHLQLRVNEHRREFIFRMGKLGLGTITAPALLSLLGVLPLACGDEEEPLIFGSSGDSVIYRVESASSHIHTFSIPKSALSNPPASGFTDSTSNNSGHTHSITLSQQQLTDINAATSVIGPPGVVAANPHPQGFDYPN